jgi:hypothetical protein
VDLLLSIARDSDAPSCSTSATTDWLRQLTRLCAAPFETQQSFGALQQVRRFVLKRLHEAHERNLLRSDPVPLSLGDGAAVSSSSSSSNGANSSNNSTSASTGGSTSARSARARPNVSFVVRLGALSIFPIIEALEPLDASRLDDTGDAPSDDESGNSVAAPRSDAPATPLRAKLLHLLLSMLQEAPAQSLIDEPADVLDAYSDVARRAALLHAPGSDTRSLALGVLVGLAVQRAHDTQLAKLCATLATAICSRGTVADGARCAHFLSHLAQHSPLTLLPLPFRWACVGAWRMPIGLIDHDSRYRGPISLASDGVFLYACCDALSHIVCLGTGVGESLATQVVGRFAVPLASAVSLCVVGSQVFFVSRRPSTTAAAADDGKSAAASSATTEAVSAVTARALRHLAGYSTNASPVGTDVSRLSTLSAARPTSSHSFASSSGFARPASSALRELISLNGNAGNLLAPSQGFSFGGAGGNLFGSVPPPPPLESTDLSNVVAAAVSSSSSPSSSAVAAAAPAEKMLDLAVSVVPTTSFHTTTAATANHIRLRCFNDDEPFPGGNVGTYALMLLASDSQLFVLMRGAESVAPSSSSSSASSHAEGGESSGSSSKAAAPVSVDVLLAYDVAGVVGTSAPQDAPRIAPKWRTVLACRRRRDQVGA